MGNVVSHFLNLFVGFDNMAFADFDDLPSMVSGFDNDSLLAIFRQEKFWQAVFEMLPD